MLELQGNALTFLAFYTESKVGKTGLTVTVDIWEGTSEIVTGGTVLELGDGLYYYTLASGSVDANALYVAVFKTATTTVDQQHIPALWVVGRTWTTRIDAAISSRSSHSAADVWSVATRTLTSFGALVTDITAALLAVKAQVIAALTPVSGDNYVSRMRGDRWSVSWEGLGDLTGVDLILTLKPSNRLIQPDIDATLQVRKNNSGLNEGLLYLNGSSSVTAAWGSLTITSVSNGDVTLALNENASKELAPMDYVYDISKYTAAAGPTTLVKDVFNVEADVTRGIS